MTTRLLATDVQALAADIVDALRPTAERVEIAGSLRRGSETVKDIEIVLLNPTPDYYTLTDTWVAEGMAAKALYGKSGSTRWGWKYRGLSYHDVRFELFTADSLNYGLIWWLRTGPADANHYVMVELKRKRAPFAFTDGYGWAGTRKLSLHSEAQLFALLGMPLIIPQDRNEQVYRQLMSDRWHEWGKPEDFFAPIETGAQAALFEDDGGDIPGAQIQRNGPSEAERRYVAEHYARRYGQTPEFWLGLSPDETAAYLRSTGQWQ